MSFIFSLLSPSAPMELDQHSSRAAAREENGDTIKLSDDEDAQTKEALLAHNAYLLQKNEELEQQIRGCVRDNEALGFEANQLRHRVNNIEREQNQMIFVKDKLSLENRRLLERNNKLADEMQIMRTQKEQLATDKVELTERLATLRQMLVPVSENQISDTDIVCKFGSLRNQILSLVRQNWEVRLKQDVELSEGQAHFFRDLANDTGDLLWKLRPYEKLRAAVFVILQAEIFGVYPYLLDEASGHLCSHLESAEAALWRVVRSSGGNKSWSCWPKRRC